LLEAKNNIVSAISSAVPILPIGATEFVAARASSLWISGTNIGVSIMPGHIKKRAFKTHFKRINCFWIKCYRVCRTRS
jgi:hypothetical protein